MVDFSVTHFYIHWVLLLLSSSVSLWFCGCQDL